MGEDKFRFIEQFEMVLRTQNASPGGKLSLKLALRNQFQRLMRNGEMLQYSMQYR